MKLKVGGLIDGRNNITKNVKDPVDGEYVVSKKYLQSLVPIKLVNSYSIGNFRLQDVDFQTSLGDAVNLKYVTDNFVKYSNGIIHGHISTIKYIKEGLHDDDATTIAYVRKTIKDNADKINEIVLSLGRSLFHHLQVTGIASSAGLTEENYLYLNKILS